jgi:DNA-directed RNA polymerase
MFDAGAARWLAWQRSLPPEQRATADIIVSSHVASVARAVENFVRSIPADCIEARIIGMVGIAPAAVVALKAALRCVTVEITPRWQIQNAIGRAIEWEMQQQWIRRERPAEWRAMEEIYKVRENRDRARKASEILARFEEEAPQIDRAAKRATSVLLYRSLMEAKCLSHTLILNKTVKEHLCWPSFGTWEALEASNVTGIEIAPARIPMIAPPLDWAGMNAGGYYTFRVQKPFIRHATSKAQQAFAKHKEPVAYWEAANAMQRIRWRVDERVLAVARKLAASKAAIAGIPSPDEFEPPPPPDNFNDDPGARAFHRRKAFYAMMRRRNRIRKGRILSMLQVAQNLAGRDIWMPMHACFRGRLYASPVELNYQGRDIERGILRFADGMPIATDSDERALVNYGAACMGMSRASDQERRKAIDSHLKEIEDTSRDPLGESLEWWSNADKPFQLLAWCMEWEAYRKHGRGFVSHLPCRIDATSSTVQISAGIMRDMRMAKWANITRNGDPVDFYAAISRETMRLLANNPSGHARRWTEFLKCGFCRDDVKPPAMVYLHGGTWQGVYREISSWYKDRATRQREEAFAYTSLGQPIMLFVRMFVSAVDNLLPSFKWLPLWLRACVDKASRCGVVLSWTTPEGLLVPHYYPMPRKARAASVNRTTFDEAAERENIVAERNAIFVNMIHSVEGAIAARTVNNSGVPVVSVFDGFACHAPSVARVAAQARHAFAHCVDAMHPAIIKRSFEGCGIRMPDPPECGSFDPMDAIESPYAYS